MPVRLDDDMILVLRLLSWDVRALCLDYLDRLLLSAGRFDTTAAKLVRRLARVGFVQIRSMALTFVDVDRPLFVWEPGNLAPDYHALAWRLEDRWRKARSRRVTLCWATEKGGRLVAGVADFSRHASQVEHDLGTANILACLWETQPHLAAGWVGEMVLRRDYTHAPWLKQVPDGAVMDSDEPREFHEFGGQYPVKRIQRFHKHCRRYKIPYRLW